MKYNFAILLLFVLLFPACDASVPISYEDEVQDGKKRALIIVDAIDKYHTVYGEYPEELSALTPLFLQSIPKTIGNEVFSYGKEKHVIYFVSFRLVSLKNRNGYCSYLKYDGSWDCGFSTR